MRHVRFPLDRRVEDGQVIYELDLQGVNERVARAEQAIDVLRDIGYPCELWRSNNRVGIVVSNQAAERLIRVHRPHWKPES